MRCGELLDLGVPCVDDARVDFSGPVEAAVADEAGCRPGVDDLPAPVADLCSCACLKAEQIPRALDAMDLEARFGPHFASGMSEIPWCRAKVNICTQHADAEAATFVSLLDCDDEIVEGLPVSNVGENGALWDSGDADVDVKVGDLHAGPDDLGPPFRRGAFRDAAGSEDSLDGPHIFADSLDASSLVADRDVARGMGDSSLGRLRPRECSIGSSSLVLGDKPIGGDALFKFAWDGLKYSRADFMAYYGRSWKTFWEACDEIPLDAVDDAAQVLARAKMAMVSADNHLRELLADRKMRG